MWFPGGILADKFGRRKVILLGTALRIITPLLFLFARTWQQLIPGLITDIVTMVYGPSVYSLILESIPAEKRTMGFGFIQMLIILSASATNILGGMIMDSVGLETGVRLILTIIIVFFSIVYLIRSKFLTETLTIKKQDQKSFSLKDFQVKGGVLGMLVTRCLYQFSSGMYLPFIIIYATDVRGFTMTQWGFIKMAYQAIWALASLPGGILAERFGKRNAILLSQVIVTIPLFSYLFFWNFNIIFAVNILAGLGAALGGAVAQGGPAWQSLITELVPPERRARTLGFMSTVAGIVSGPSSFVGGALWSFFTPSSTIMVAALLSTVSAINFFITVKEPQKKLKNGRKPFS